MACSNHWKIDKIDKLFICLLLIFICIFEFCNTFVFADENNILIDELPFIENAIIKISSASIESTEGGENLYYLELSDDLIYHFTFTGNNLRYGFGNQVSVGSTVYQGIYIGNVENYTLDFYGSDYDYIFFEFSIVDDENMSYSLTTSYVDGLQSSVDSLVNNVGISQLWSIFDISVKYIVVCVLFAIGVIFIISINKGIKGKSVF